MNTHEMIPAANKTDARTMADALRRYDGLDAIARFRAEHGGWQVYIRPWAGCEVAR